MLHLQQNKQFRLLHTETKLMFSQIMPVLPTHPQPIPPLQPLTVPDVMGQTGLVQVILNHSQFAQSLQTGAFKEGMGKGDGQS